MAILSQREAAKRAGVNLRSVQVALESGRLESLDEEDVGLWAHSRGDLVEAAQTMRTILDMWDDQKTSIERQALKNLDSSDVVKHIMKNSIQEFVLNVLMLDEGKRYSYSEGIEFRDEMLVRRFKNYVPGHLHKSLKVRFMFVIYVILHESMGKMCDRLEEDSGFQIEFDHIDIGLAEFVQFYSTYFKYAEKSGVLNLLNQIDQE